MSLIFHPLGGKIDTCSVILRRWASRLPRRFFSCEPVSAETKTAAAGDTAKDFAGAMPGPLIVSVPTLPVARVQRANQVIVSCRR